MAISNFISSVFQKNQGGGIVIQEIKKCGLAIRWIARVRIQRSDESYNPSTNITK
jgi:hypothetical protein